MNLFPLFIAAAFVLVAAAIVALWPSMDAGFKRMFLVVVAIAVVICVVAVFWPLMAGHMIIR